MVFNRKILNKSLAAAACAVALACGAFGTVYASDAADAQGKPQGKTGVGANATNLQTAYDYWERGCFKKLKEDYDGAIADFTAFSFHAVKKLTCRFYSCHFYAAGLSGGV